MRTDSEVLSFVAACGPTLVLLLAVLAVAWILQRGWKPKGSEPRTAVDYVSRIEQSPTDLEIALRNAASLNPFDPHARTTPGVQLGTLVRFEPIEYQAAAHDVVRLFREGKVISIDLAAMDGQQAARLVDFCSGMTAVTTGWIFRVTDKVILLNPPS